MTSSLRINLFLQVILFVELHADVQTFYPCERIDFTRDRFECDLCRCVVEVPQENFTSELCASIKQLDCQRTKQLDEFPSDSNSQLKLKHFDDRTAEILFRHSSWFFTEIFFISFQSNRFVSPLPTSLFAVNSLIFQNSFIRDTFWLKDLKIRQFIFKNSTLNFDELNFSTIEFFEISSIRTFGQRLIFNGSTSLTHLTIVDTFDFELHGNFPHLSFLKIEKTNLTNSLWNEILSRVQLPDLNTLILRENLLTNINNKFPSTIRFLDLSRNQIRSLDYFSFKSLYSLNVLNLSSNSPLQIQQDTFTRIPYLEILDLTHTNLSQIDDDLFLPLQKLRFLNLSSNQFERLPSLPIPYDVHSIDSYDQYLPVLDIDLSMNKISKFSNEIFAFSSTQDKYILTIHLKQNQIKSFNLFNETKRRGPFIEFDLRENPFECDCQLFNVVSNLLKSESKMFIDRVKFLHFNELICSTEKILPSKSSRFVDLQASQSFCSYNVTCCSSSSCFCKIRCPKNCFCAHSADWSTNQVNCSSANLTEIPLDLPSTTTHLDLTRNQIKNVDQRFKNLINLKSLSLANNQLDRLVDSPFDSLKRLEHLDLSSNRIETISSDTFASLTDLTELFLHENFWIPQFYRRTNFFQSNVRLNFLTYGTNFICKRSIVADAISANSCCLSTKNPSCFPVEIDEKHAKNFFAFRNDSTTISSKSFDEKIRSFFLYGSSIILIGILALIFVVFFYKKRSFFSKEKFLSHHELNKKSNAYDKPLTIPNSHSNTIYDHGQTTKHHSLSMNDDDDDDYASIPLTNSQSDLTVPIRQILLVPPLPPPRNFSRKNSSTRQLVEMKFDVLVLYLINDCEFVHENLSGVLQRMYGRRYTFHFVHRDRITNDFNWLINHSSSVLLILKKPHHILRDYIKLFSSNPTLKSFIIFISSDSSNRTVSLKCREKLARLYRTSNIYTWNYNPNALIHEQLDLFLELNCRSAD